MNILVCKSCTSKNGITFPIRIQQRGKYFHDSSSPMRKKLLYIQITAVPMPVWKSERIWWGFLLEVLNTMLSSGIVSWNPNTAPWLEKQWISWEGGIVPANERLRGSTIVWYHTLHDMVLEASFSLGLFNRFTKGCIHSSVLLESMEMESRPCSIPWQLDQKCIALTT